MKIKNRYITICPGGKYENKWFVDYSEVDNGNFVVYKTMKSFRDIKEANAYAERKNKRINAEIIYWDNYKDIHIDGGEM